MFVLIQILLPFLVIHNFIYSLKVFSRDGYHKVAAAIYFLYSICHTYMSRTLTHIIIIALNNICTEGRNIKSRYAIFRMRFYATNNNNMYTTIQYYTQ